MVLFEHVVFASKDQHSNTPTQIRGTDKETQNSLNISFVISRSETLIDDSDFSFEEEMEEEEEITMNLTATRFTSRRLLSTEDEDENGVDYYGDSLVCVVHSLI